jgi:hypothetical protein
VSGKFVIWKHDLGDHVSAELDLPRGAKVLHFAEQHGRFRLWEQHDPDATQTERRSFRIVGTGHAVDLGPCRYIATALFQGGAYVFHLFELEGPT